jgi:2-oxoisovalerate dehydrogenase E1 component
MARLAAKETSLEARFAAWVAERFPFALAPARTAWRRALRGRRSEKPEELRELRAPLREALASALPPADVSELPETTPGVSAAKRLAQERDALLDEAEGFLLRQAVLASFTADEKRELLRGMVLTRAVDNRLKSLFLGGEVRFGGASFQGKGFRSLGQEAIYGAALRLRRGAPFRDEDGGYRGDVVAPLIRDLGVVLAMRPEPATVRMVLSAQMGKAGPPMDGRDLHVGDWGFGVLPASAPLTISAMTLAGAAMAFARDGSRRVAVTFIGEGGASLGEWHEAINLCAARRLPAVFCLQNNQTALSTPVHEQAAVRTFADKASGYGVPGLTVDGTDPEAIAAAFSWAAERAREGRGPTLLELVAMRMCGHAHHDDMLYLGKEPPPSWEYPRPVPPGYADGERYAFWAARDPIPTYAAKLVAEGVLREGDLDRLKSEAEALVEAEARAVVAAPWPDPAAVGVGVVAEEPPRAHREPMEGRDPGHRPAATLPALEAGPPFDAKGKTFLEAVMLGVGDALRADPRVFVYGEDVGGKYGNAFLLLRPLLETYGERILNSTLSEAGTLGVCIGAALCGQRPIGEIQFNDFVATGFNQLVNNAAKIRYRWGASVPMVVRLPWGGLRRAGPYHSQNTEAWFYRTPGLKIVVPSTPADARALLAAAVADPDPVLYYEHIALYRDPRVKQLLSEEAPAPLPLGKAALRRTGRDLALVSYGAYVHVAQRVAETLSREDGIETAVLDLRSLAPLDREALLAVARHCGKVLIAHEDSRTGGIGESLASVIQEEAFEELDAPVRVVGALDTPVPYAPPLEDAFLPGEAGVLRAARLLLAY